jgi:hypothetical protein
MFQTPLLTPCSTRALLVLTPSDIEGVDIGQLLIGGRRVASPFSAAAAIGILPRAQLIRNRAAEFAI